MYVKVEHCLPSSRTRVEANVVAVRQELEIELALDLVDQFKQRDFLLRRGSPPVGKDPPRDDQGVSGADLECVPEGEGQLVARGPSVRRYVEEGRSLVHVAQPMCDSTRMSRKRAADSRGLSGVGSVEPNRAPRREISPRHPRAPAPPDEN